MATYNFGSNFKDMPANTNLSYFKGKQPYLD